MIAFFISVSYVVTVSDFYFHIEYDLLKQQEKIAFDKKSIRYYDIIELNTFCNMWTFKVYMSFQHLTNELRVNKICSQLNELYYTYNSGQIIHD